jgi:hypothetical protein
MGKNFLMNTFLLFAGGKRMSVYVVQGEHGGPFKVGYARDINKRMKQLQTGYPYLLLLRGELDMDEKEVHYTLSKDALMGEWFQTTPYSIAWLATFGIHLIPKVGCADCSCRLGDALQYVKDVCA